MKKDLRMLDKLLALKIPFEIVFNDEMSPRLTGASLMSTDIVDGQVWILIKVEGTYAWFRLAEVKEFIY